MLTSIEVFLLEWQSEFEITKKLFEEITNASLTQKIAPHHFTLSQLAWHITVSVHEILTAKQLEFESPGEESECPQQATIILDAYKKVNSDMIHAMRSQWKDKNLDDVMNVYGLDWSNHQTLRMLINHQIHHRGQLTVLMRQAGLFVPGTYGPSREQWAQMGMNSPAFID